MSALASKEEAEVVATIFGSVVLWSIVENDVKNNATSGRIL
jgi:hypothetical protein